MAATTTNDGGGGVRGGGASAVASSVGPRWWRRRGPRRRRWRRRSQALLGSLSLQPFSVLLVVAVAYRVCALPPAPLGGESDKDRRPDDKSFMVLRPHVDGGRRRT